MAKDKENRKAKTSEPVEQTPEVETTENPAQEVPAEESAAAQDAQLETLQHQNAELSDKLLRQIAEFDNYRKRTSREKDEVGALVKGKCMTDLLPVLDNFERAMQAESTDADFKKGMELIFKSLEDLLKKQGVTEIPSEGQPFNPELHYAVSTVADESLGENVVAVVLQKGYQLGEKVLRHAMVSVANP